MTPNESEHYITHKHVSFKTDSQRKNETVKDVEDLEPNAIHPPESFV